MELGTGTKGAPLAPPGSELKSAETIRIGDLGDMIGNLAPVAQQVLQNLNQRLTELQVTVARVNDLLNDRNRANISDGLGNLNAMLAEDRPKVSASLSNVQAASAKIVPLLDNFKTTMNASERLPCRTLILSCWRIAMTSVPRRRVEADAAHGFIAHGAA